MQTLVIGDIHGCYFELQALLDKAGLAAEDRIVSLGDCVDRGPETPAVLKFFQETSRAQLLLGNHERKHVRASRGELALARSQSISKIQFGETYSEAVDFMSRLPMYLDLPVALLVHGYIEPGLPLDKQMPQVLCGNRSGEKYLQTRYDRPWYELYDGGKPLLVGHQNYTGSSQPFVYRERVFGLDTDCVTGKNLTALLLPHFRFLSVPSRGDLWSQVATQYPRPARKPRPVPLVLDPGYEQDLVKLLPRIKRLCDVILQELRTEAGDTATAEELEKRFAMRVGQGKLANLLHLVRLGKLNVDVARRILQTPASLQEILGRLDPE
jgi:serine/threonine protein phosphatase 1